MIHFYILIKYNINQVKEAEDGEEEEWGAEETEIKNMHQNKDKRPLSRATQSNSHKKRSTLTVEGNTFPCDKTSHPPGRVFHSTKPCKPSISADPRHHRLRKVVVACIPQPHYHSLSPQLPG